MYWLLLLPAASLILQGPVENGPIYSVDDRAARDLSRALHW